MNSSAPDFKSANERQAAPIFLLLDFHTPPNSPSAARLALRDATTRFVHKLFLYPPPSTARSCLTALVVAPVAHETASVTLSLLTESAALGDTRNQPTVHSRLRHASRPVVQSMDVDTHAQGLMEAMREWPIEKATIIVACAALKEKLEELTACTVYSVEEGTRELDELVAKIHETPLELSVPTSDMASRILTTTLRPRVLGHTNPPQGLVATRLVILDTLPADVLTGGSWTAFEGGVESVCLELCRRRVGLVCIGDGAMYVIIGAANGLGLVREVGHGGTVMPLPQASGGEEVELGVMTEDGYDAWQVRFGRWGGASGARVAFDALLGAEM